MMELLTQELGLMTQRQILQKVGNNVVINGDGSTYVCWAWKEVQVLAMVAIKVMGSSDGPFVYTDFKPLPWLMTKIKLQIIGKFTTTKETLLMMVS